jgi:hypothetical protein
LRWFKIKIRSGQNEIRRDLNKTSQRYIEIQDNRTRLEENKLIFD